jgi:hypothetical protein
MKPIFRVHHPCGLQVTDLKIDDQPFEGTWSLLCVGKVVETVGGW